jgi:hypothetical protein
MMILLFRNCSDFIRKLQRLCEILEFESLFQAFHAVHILDLPSMDMKQQILDFGISEGWLTTPTSHTFSSRQINHSLSLDHFRN